MHIIDMIVCSIIAISMAFIGVMIISAVGPEIWDNLVDSYKARRYRRRMRKAMRKGLYTYNYTMVYGDSWRSNYAFPNPGAALDMALESCLLRWPSTVEEVKITRLEKIGKLKLKV